MHQNTNNTFNLDRVIKTNSHTNSQTNRTNTLSKPPIKPTLKKPETWRLISYIETEGPIQMAIDEAILSARQKNLVPNTLRFYTWSKKTASVGYFQSPNIELNLPELEKNKIDLVRRITGGGTVFHDKELTYSIVISEDTLKNKKDILESYKEICQPIINSLSSIGIKAEFSGINDIITNNKKISGNAQTRRGNIILQHGTILLEVDKDLMFSLLKIDKEKIKDKQIKEAKDRVTSIYEELGKIPSIKELIFTFSQSFRTAFRIELKEENLTEYEKTLAANLAKTKYQTKEWTYKR